VESSDVGRSDDANNCVCSKERSRCLRSSFGTSSSDSSDGVLDRLLKLVIARAQRVKGDRIGLLAVLLVDGAMLCLKTPRGGLQNDLPMMC